jgi:recombination protein RecT
MNGKAVATRPTDMLKQIMAMPSVKEQFENCLGDSSRQFVASLIDLYGSDNYLQQCEPKAVVMEALKAATLKLPINKSLGFAYVIPYKNHGKQEPQFQIGYKGLIQLAMRTGKYRHINADCVYEGELIHQDKLTGEIELGEPKSDKVVGYFAMFETINGFRKVIYWPTEKVMAHAKRFSKSFSKDFTPWKSDFDGMAFKTLLKNLLGKYGIMSIDMEQAFIEDAKDFDSSIDAEISDNANTGDVVDVGDPDDFTEEEPTEEQVKNGIAVKLKALQDLDSDVFQEAKTAAGIAKTKPFSEITQSEFNKLSGIFTAKLDAKNGDKAPFEE